jgi:hypothetical protein
MEELKKLLTDPFDKVEKNDLKGFQDKCFEIAEDLFCNYCINCNGEKYYFAEIEFYYYEGRNFNEKWNEVTYSRKCKAGEIFYHLSGMDISFNSNLPQDFKKKKVGYGGGILIRSVVEKDGNTEKIIVGPLTCVNKMLNACHGKKMPFVDKAKAGRNVALLPTYRYLGKKDFDNIEKKESKDSNQGIDLKLAFFDDALQPKWNNARSSYYSNRLTKYKNK